MRIENEKISLEVGERGGSMVSLFDKKRGEELLYQPHPDSWQGQDIIIFPVVAMQVCIDFAQDFCSVCCISVCDTVFYGYAWRSP